MKCVSPADNPQAVTFDLSNLYVVLFLSYVNTTLMHVLSLHYQVLYIWQHFFFTYRYSSDTEQSYIHYYTLHLVTHHRN